MVQYILHGSCAVPAVYKLIDHSNLDTEPPRPVPIFFFPNLLGEYLLERRPRSYVDPFTIGCLVLGGLLSLLNLGLWIWSLVFFALLVRLTIAIWPVIARAYADTRLMRYGVIVQAHVIRVRAGRSDHGALAGAFLDCAIPLSPRLSVVGSVWIPDATEAIKLWRQGHLRTICLPTAPSNWRLIEGDRPDLRYDLVFRIPLGEVQS